MKKRESVQFFLRFLLLSLLSIINIVICLTIVDNGLFFGIVAVILAIGNVFLLFYWFVKSIRMFFRHISDKDKKRFELLYIINILFSAVILSLYLFFYF
jgi:small-conductance mechanosensitive channel